MTENLNNADVTDAFDPEASMFESNPETAKQLAELRDEADNLEDDIAAAEGKANVNGDEDLTDFVDYLTSVTEPVEGDNDGDFVMDFQLTAFVACENCQEQLDNPAMVLVPQTMNRVFRIVCDCCVD